MLHVILPIILAAVSFSGGLLVARLIRRPTDVGQRLFLSVDAYDSHLLSSDKIANVRAAKRQELAEAAHGETGIEVIVLKQF